MLQLEYHSLVKKVVIREMTEACKVRSYMYSWNQNFIPSLIFRRIKRSVCFCIFLFRSQHVYHISSTRSWIIGSPLRVIRIKSNKFTPVSYISFFPSLDSYLMVWYISVTSNGIRNVVWTVLLQLLSMHTFQTSLSLDRRILAFRRSLSIPLSLGRSQPQLEPSYQILQPSRVMPN